MMLQFVAIISFLGRINPATVLQVEKSEGHRIEYIGSINQRVNFTWQRVDGIASWHQAWERCNQQDAFLPKAEEMRYFYKTLRSDDAILPSMQGKFLNQTKNGVNFYLKDILEATMDYPNSESGERMCLVVEKRPNSPCIQKQPRSISPRDIEAGKLSVEIRYPWLPWMQQGRLTSESKPLCDPFSDKWIDPQPQWIIDLKNKAELRQEHICFTKTAFYLAMGAGLFVFVIFLVALFILARRYWELVRLTRKATRKEAVTQARQALSTTDGTATRVEPISTGQWDILADSAFFRGPAFASKASSKQALLNDGLQTLSGGLNASARTAIPSSQEKGLFLADRDSVHQSTHTLPYL